jgi:hypothetical protein
MGIAVFVLSALVLGALGLESHLVGVVGGFIFLSALAGCWWAARRPDDTEARW